MAVLSPHVSMLSVTPKIRDGQQTTMIRLHNKLVDGEPDSDLESLTRLTLGIAKNVYLEHKAQQRKVPVTTKSEQIWKLLPEREGGSSDKKFSQVMSGKREKRRGKSRLEYEDMRALIYLNLERLKEELPMEHDILCTEFGFQDRIHANHNDAKYTIYMDSREVDEAINRAFEFLRGFESLRDLSRSLE